MKDNSYQGTEGRKVLTGYLREGGGRGGKGEWKESGDQLKVPLRSPMFLASLPLLRM